MAKKKEEKITVEAEVSVKAGDQERILRTFSASWALAMEWSKSYPLVEINFVRFVRKN